MQKVAKDEINNSFNKFTILGKMMQHIVENKVLI